MKKLGNVLISWGVAITIGTLIVNLIMFIYNRPVGWIDRQYAATYAIWNPGKLLIHATEGFGVYRVDENGYLNEGKLIDDDYVIVVGASYTQGKEVRLGKRYTDLLNKKFRDDKIIDDDEVCVYNLSQDGYYFPDIVNGFNCILSEFPNSSAIVIEIGNTYYSPDELRRSLEQRKYNPNENGSIISRNLTTNQKLKFAIKEYFPLVNQLNGQKEALREIQEIKKTNNMINYDDYEISLQEVLSLIRNEYRGNIYILYHPNVELTNTGMSIKPNRTDEIFAKTCKENGIVFIDMSDRFLSDYSADYSVPYGYWNTTMGSGHLNQSGHRAIAEVLYPMLYLEGR